MPRQTLTPPQAATARGRHAPAAHAEAHPHHGPEPGAPDESPVGDVVLTVRPASGLSGDMLLSGLAALLGLDAPALDALTEELRLPALRGVLRLEARQVNGIAGVGCRIQLPHEHSHRSLADILALLDASALPAAAADLARQAFTVLAAAEGAVHGKSPEQVTFHEVGALDSILDICLACRLFTLLAPRRFVCSPLPLADGTVHCAHGCLPAPAPAVLHMLQGVAVQGFDGQGETVTPTALCLLKAFRADFGPWPAMTVRKSCISYGDKVFPHVPNGALWALGTAL
ncbi:nickel insertion protein [Desulfovibrio legallii]|jgi:uncharacterized protein (DUF111 family)|uniref:LarC family nickel insertion protein n=1 Tax=Desulfovibrio legallii TaxID=571438 RepID=A0A1G7NQ41_9BACT|nr:nickel insertion protein [Desulfovibrio legallii]SDF76083.1 hypothetical protein SAMN05192586_11247 [Desulfovibrio legallii]